MIKLAQVKADLPVQNVMVAITSDDKPEISEEIQLKWQKIIDLAAKIIGVPSGLVTRVTEKELEVFLTSETAGNIFSREMKFALGTGIYCEHVIGTRKQNIIPNALKEEYWKENPSVPFNIISYMGVPILWPDGEVFGTFCMLDNKENHYSELFNELLNSLKEIIQNDLKSLMMYQQAKNDILNKETQLKEIHHRVKNHFNLLISTLHIQSSLGAGTNSFESALVDIQSRISAISVIHDRLYHSMNLEHVSLGDYLKELGKHIISLISTNEIEYECNYETILVDAKISVPCGLILNELITNSLKYAFHGNSKPKISVDIKKENINEVVLIYHDNGKGLPLNFNPEESTTLGMTLIRHSVNNLEGSCATENKNGFFFRMNFKF